VADAEWDARNPGISRGGESWTLERLPALLASIPTWLQLIQVVHCVQCLDVFLTKLGFPSVLSTLLSILKSATDVIPAVALVSIVAVVMFVVWLIRSVTGLVLSGPLAPLATLIRNHAYWADVVVC
jgi:hypothetical protein